MLTQTRTLPFAKTPPWFTRLLPIWQGLIEFELRFPLPPDSLRKLSSPPPAPAPSPTPSPTYYPFWPTPPQAVLPTPVAGRFHWEEEAPHELPFDWQYPALRRKWDHFRAEAPAERWHSNRHRRDRRRLHRAVADLLHADGLDGAACVRRARCEAALSAAKKMDEAAPAAAEEGDFEEEEEKQEEEEERSIFDDFLRLIFIMPPENKTTTENCADLKEDCPFSLLEAFDFEFP
ncbi:Protein of unknown function [Gryllus bimaculatus]|nr:Protein of unknown function [Gryllus bimaculatus]